MQQAHNAGPRRLPLEEIQAFVEVATAGSFTAAAQRLALSHSSLSRKVAHLEDRLGVRLFDRKAHGVQLTIEGAWHFQRFRDGLDLIGGALRTSAQPQPETVRLSLLQSFAVTWLFPRHLRLEASSGVAVAYQFDRRTTDFADGTDLAIRFGAGDWQGTRSVGLEAEDLRPMAAPAIAAALAGSADASDFLRFPLVHIGTEIAWRTWLQAEGIGYRLRAQDFVFDEVPTMLSAVRHGLGIGLSRPAFRAEVDGKALCHVHPRVLPYRPRYHLVRDAARPLRSGARRYAAALLAEASVAAEAIAAFLC